MKQFIKKTSLFALLCMGLTLLGASNAAIRSTASGGDPDETINVHTSAITGANSVEVWFYRVGPEAGTQEVNITYTVLFNEGTSSQSTETFTKHMFNGETVATDVIPGPIPTGYADVIDVVWEY